MNRLDQFLNTAARQMRIMPAAQRDDELRELRGHLEQRAEDYANQGMSDDAARLRALEGLGSPRKLGASLCDAWEGIAFGWWRLIASVIGVTAFWSCGMIGLAIVASMIVPRISAIALLPEAVAALCAFYLALPLLCGWLFSHWLGRRGRLVATLYFMGLALSGAKLSFSRDPLGLFTPPLVFLEMINAAWLPYFCVILALAGAWTEYVRQTQTRYNLAAAGSYSIEPGKIFRIRFKSKLWRNALLLVILVSALYVARIFQIHLQTPTATLKSYLVSNQRMNFGEFEPPKILATRELPAQSPAEIAGTQKRVWFKIEERMTPGYKARRVTYLQQMLEGPAQKRPFEDETLRRSLARLQRNRQITQGVTTIAKTPEGWKVDAKNAPSLGDWAYDLAYDR